MVSTSRSSDAPAAAGASVSMGENCLRSAVEIRALLRQFVEGDLPMSLSTPEGVSYTTSLWAEDVARGVLVFSADPSDARVAQLVASAEVVAVGYLDSVKIQFDLTELVQVHGLGASALNAAYPHEVFRFQRRGSYRVQPLVSSTAPTAVVGHPDRPGHTLRVRVLDVSHQGVALHLCESLPSVRIGSEFSDVQLNLDAQTHLRLQLKVVRLDAMAGAAAGTRLGCEMMGLKPADARALQRYLDQTQKRLSLLTL